MVGTARKELEPINIFGGLLPAEVDVWDVEYEYIVQEHDVPRIAVSAMVSYQRQYPVRVSMMREVEQKVVGLGLATVGWMPATFAHVNWELATWFKTDDEAFSGLNHMLHRTMTLAASAAKGDRPGITHAHTFEEFQESINQRLNERRGVAA